jgi:hypothetical protein
MLAILAADSDMQALEEVPLAIVVADGSPWPSSSWSIRSNTNSKRRQQWSAKQNL